ncbi:Myb/SANT-like DNA-binding domain protein [Thalictrum thalictroides]|uniref:Myb/SANT-like DNA-binding domain protein n=1 Tax=Thalictrum thalictroides TaxID=46969 RepID=A0A7J6XB28_THATH|nr:Myb/SANT-like DNA-binding domain protein [Thalictrum thalictroides]
MDDEMTQSERPRTIWTPSMDRYFIDLVTDQVRQRNMIDHAFRKQVWVHMTTLFNRKFGYQYEKDVLKNRYKSLRRKYNEITAFLNQNGFHWDGVRQMVVADDQVWDNYIKVHPEKRSYRTKVLPYYSDLCMIYGNVIVDGTLNELGDRENFNGESSRTNSAAEVSGDLQSPHTPVAGRNPVGDAQELSHSEQDMVHRSTDEGVTPSVCGITDKDIEANERESLIPVDVRFAVEAAPSILQPCGGYESRVSWTPLMDRYFVNLMLDHVRRGNLINHSFSKEAWIHMTTLFSEKFEFQYENDVLNNRFEFLEKQYTAIKNLLDQDGFHWDETLEMVSAEQHVWDDYMKACPDAQQYRGRPVPHYNNMCLIYGGINEEQDGIIDGQEDHPGYTTMFKDDIQVMRNGVNSPGPLSPSTPMSFRDLFSDEQVESSYLGGEMDISNHLNKRLCVAPSASEHFKKPRKGTSGSLMEALREMATAVTLLKRNKKENGDFFTIKNVMDALQAVPDMDEDLILDACDFLEDEKKAKTFLALDDRLRKKWLMRKLRTAG